jgi:hypothetical protein
MSFFREHIVPLVTILIALFALVIVSARSFLASDLAVPAPSDDLNIVFEQNY